MPRRIERLDTAVPPRPEGTLREELAQRLPDHLRAPAADSRPPKPPDSEEPSYWARVGHFEELWQRHVERWPDQPQEKEPADRTRDTDPPGSWRGDGGRYLTPEQNARADDLIAKIREPEKAITADLKSIEQDNAQGGYLAGLEHRLKGDHRLKEKLADKLEFLGASIDEAAGQIGDAVRYTFCFAQAEYAAGCGAIRQDLETGGYRMTRSENYWITGDQYKGINTRWETVDGDLFELQFHTEESSHAKNELTHRSYERLRRPDVSRAERVELEYYQRTIVTAIPHPPGAAEVPGVKEGI